MFIFIDAGAATETQNHEEEENNDDDDDDEEVNHVELPSVEENEEEILFNEWTKLFLWDCDINKRKSCGAGDIKMLFHPVNKRYRVFMCQEGDKKVLVNHCITRTTHPKPMSNANARFLLKNLNRLSVSHVRVHAAIGKVKSEDKSFDMLKS
uniref:RanBD1 domain-containing protein n=1 Tax=Sinocyclocheilus grahami TaxID=75366 RepID=A0A672Q0Q4_SINGR